MAGFVFQGRELPPGFRFQPTDQEIIVHYLNKKIASDTAPAATAAAIIADVDIYKFDPWDLPGKAIFGEGEWFFFSPRDRKYPNGARPNRAAGSGYWKATGTDKPILAAGGARCLGVKKSLVFYQGRSPRGAKTDWLMHEYRLLAAHHKPNDSMRLDDWVLCRVRKKGAAFAPDTDGTVAAPRATDYYAGKEGEAAARVAEVQVPGAAAACVFGDGLDGHHGWRGAESAAPGALVSVLETIKRNLSFQAIDDVYLLQPSNKRANCMRVCSGDDEWLSPATSFSIFEDD